MIKQELGVATLQGNTTILVSELAALTNAVAKEISTDSRTSYSMVINKVKEAVDIYRLADTGMTTKEAIRALGFEDTIDEAIVMDGTTTVVTRSEEDLIYNKTTKE